MRQNVSIQDQQFKTTILIKELDDTESQSSPFSFS